VIAPKSLAASEYSESDLRCDVRIFVQTACSAIVLSLTALGTAQESSANAQVKVCVAEVNNRTSQSLWVERLTKELARRLSGDKIAAMVMESATTSDRELHPTVENGEEIKRNECGYLVLTQVTEQRLRTTGLGPPQISIGRNTPNIDASDPGNGRGTSNRENLVVNFAVYRPGNPEPMLETQTLDRTSSNASDSMMDAMGQEANRIRRELKKK